MQNKLCGVDIVYPALAHLPIILNTGRDEFQRKPRLLSPPDFTSVIAVLITEIHSLRLYYLIHPWLFP